MFLLSIVLIIFCISFLKHLNCFYPVTTIVQKIKTIDGLPLENYVAHAYKHFWGNSFDLISMDIEDVFYYTRNLAQKFKRNFIQEFLFCPVYNIIDPNDAELVLNDSRILTKGLVYKFFYPFLKTGLLTSTGNKWRNRRRLLTPAFHFNLLEEFMDIFNKESLKVIDHLNEQLNDKGKNDVISLTELIPRFTLNNICETAMGVSLDDGLNGDEYRQNIKEVEEGLIKRLQNPFLIFDWLYFSLKVGKNYLKTMDKLHKFSSGIIEKRRNLMDKKLGNKESQLEQNQNGIYRKQRYAMLDTMLRAEMDGFIDHAGICEEVDTVIFEGFDTTSINLIFALMNLGCYMEMQQKCYDEIQKYINDDLKYLNIEQLNNLKYLDCFIKETQRLYPSVPMVIRKCTTDLALKNNIFLPKGAQINIHIFDMQRNPKYFKNPDKFQPERFMAADAEQRHPFAFIPFSAGQRNCIGQKLAMLEMKTLLVYVIKHFQMTAVTDPKSIRFSAGFLLRTKTDIQIKICKR